MALQEKSFIEFALRAFTGGFAHLPAQCRIIERAKKCSTQCGPGNLGREQAGVSILDLLDDTARRSRDHAISRGHRFKNNTRKIFRR